MTQLDKLTGYLREFEPQPVYFMTKDGLHAYDGKDRKPVYTAIDPASAAGDYSCEIEYTKNEDGSIEVKSWRFLAKKPKLGKRKKRNG